MKTTELSAAYENRNAGTLSATSMVSSLLAGIGTRGLRWWAGLLLTITLAPLARGQAVALGTASFDASSDQVPADSYWPMPGGVIFKYDGYGAFAGATRTESYTPGQLVAGVKTIKWHMETDRKSTRLNSSHRT